MANPDLGQDPGLTREASRKPICKSDSLVGSLPAWTLVFDNGKFNFVFQVGEPPDVWRGMTADEVKNVIKEQVSSEEAQKALDFVGNASTLEQ